LLRVDISGTREGLAGISLIRREELDGFIYGLFGKEESLDLPERARRALTALSEMRAMLEGLRVVASDPTKPATFDDIAGALGNVRELTRISEREIHEAVLAGTPPDAALYADSETHSALTRAAGGSSFEAVICRRARGPTGGSSGCSGCVSWSMRRNCQGCFFRDTF
jgi:hypothetical protein